MGKRLFIAVHPAPYITNMVKFHLEKEMVLCFLESFSLEKPWEKPLGTSQLFSIRQIRSCEELIFPGWYNRKVIIAVLFSYLLRRRIGIFVDHINDNKSISIWQRAYLSLADDIYTASYSCKGLLNQKGFSKVQVLPYGLSDSRFYMGNVFSATIPRRVFIANRFIERKGWRTFINALHHLSSFNFHFVIAGVGPMEKEIRHMMDFHKLKYEMLGWIELADYTEQIEICDIYVHFSDFEPYGIPPVDAYVRGKKVVVSKSTFSLEPLFNEEGVFVFDSSDSSALVNCLKQAANSKESYSIKDRMSRFSDIYNLNGVQVI